jgi:large subunit ribosomal protein L31
MKAQIHPKWYPEAKVSCACGNTFVVGATVPELTVEVCSACHPFYTGQMKYVDTAGRVEAFKSKQAGASKKVVSKKQKRKLKQLKKIQEELERPDTLEALRSKK